jgi:hypothetical protein
MSLQNKTYNDKIIPQVIEIKTIITPLNIYKSAT